MANVYFFEDTSEAYGECQCNDEIQNGDILVTDDVIGIADTWPFGITVCKGELHEISPDVHFSKIADALGMDSMVFLDSIQQAVALADERKLPVDPTILKFLEAA